MASYLVAEEVSDSTEDAVVDKLVALLELVLDPHMGCEVENGDPSGSPQVLHRGLVWI